MSSLVFIFVAASSYDHFGFLQHIRPSVFPYFNSNVVLPSAEGSLRNVFADFLFLCEDLPTIVTLLLRAGLVPLAVILVLRS